MYKDMQYFSYIVVVSFFVWKKPKYNEKTPNLPLVIDKLEHFFEHDLHCNLLLM
jgi:hypothetical protein